MPLTQDDRIAFSLAIIEADSTIAGIQNAQNSINSKIAGLQKLDTANKNLFDPINALVNGYQSELQRLDGNGRTQITESDIVNAGNHTLGNIFFPNNTTITIPSLVPYGNVWSKLNPFALGYGIGKSYIETYTPVTKEPDLIAAAQAYITAAGFFTNIQNTTGQHCIDGTCSLPQYLDQVTCEANSGIWTPGESIVAFADIQTLKTNLVTAITTLQTFLNAELLTIVSTDTDSTRSAQNVVAVSNISTIILPAIATWLAYVDFNTAHGQTTCAGFNGYDSNLLAPTKLHSTQLAALQTALSNRSSFVTTRSGQLNVNLGSIAQNLDTGNVTGSGMYLQRYSFLTLRLNALNGTLTQVLSLQGGSNAQTQIIANILSTKATYQTIISVSTLSASANGTSMIHVDDASLFSIGDFIYLFAEGQVEMPMAIKAINGKAITLNSSVPQKYTTSNNARIYKTLI